MDKSVRVLIIYLGALVTSGICADVATTFYPYGPENGDVYGCPNDDSPYGPIHADNGFPFFGEIYEQIYISVNGAITGVPFDDFEPKRFPLHGSADVSSLCNEDDIEDPNCWLNNYYESPSDWQDNLERDNFPCLNGVLFENNTGRNIENTPFTFRFPKPEVYEAPECIDIATEAVSEDPGWIIAVYWHDIDIQYGDGKFLYRESTDPSILAMAKEDVERMDGVTGEFNPTWAFVITWMNATFYQGENFGYPADCENEGFTSDCEPGGFVENSMQMVVATDGTKSYGIFNYGAMNWGGGQVGFDAGDNVNFCSVSGSRTEEILNIQHRSNVKVKGRYVMSFSDMNFNADMCEPHASFPACTCDDGYQGILCGEEVNDCEFVVCQEGGLCVDGHNNYTCECGLDCQQESNCTNDGTQYICQCVHPSHSGTLCEIIDLCYNVTCANNGTCSDGICACAVGFLGERCEDRDYCQGVSCAEGSACQNLAETKSFFCDFCAADPCQNGGTCENNEDDTGYVCVGCASGYSGINCEQYDYCGLSTVFCQESTSSCVNAIDGYICDCLTDEWHGEFCNISNKCSSSPCQNGGTCTPQETEYKCHCPKGYNTTNCEEEGNGPEFGRQVQDSLPSLLASVGGTLLGLLGLLAIVGIIIFLVLKRRKRKVKEAEEKKTIVPVRNNWTTTTHHGIKPKGHPPMIHSNTLTSLEAVPNSQPPAIFTMET